MVHKKNSILSRLWQQKYWRAQNDLVEKITTHIHQLPDKTRLNFALATTRSFSDVYPKLLDDNVRSYHMSTYTPWQRHDPWYNVREHEHQDCMEGRSALVFAIESGDALLLDSCLETIGFWGWKDDESSQEFFERSYARLLSACLSAGSLESLTYLKEKNPELLVREVRNYDFFGKFDGSGHLYQCRQFQLAEFLSTLLWTSFSRANEEHLVATEAEFDEFQDKHGKILFRGQPFEEQISGKKDLEQSIGLRGLTSRLNVSDGYPLHLRLSWGPERWGFHTRFQELYTVGAIKVFSSLVTEFKTEVRKSAYRQLLVGQCEIQSQTSAASIAAILKYGELPIDTVFEGTAWSFRNARGYSSVDIAASLLNIKALRIVLQLGANPGGARSIYASYYDKGYAQIAPPLWHLFNTRFYIDIDGLRWYSSKSCYESRREAAGWHQLCLHEGRVDEGSNDNHNEESRGKFFAAWDVEASLQSLTNLCKRIGVMAKILLEHGVNYHDLYETEDKLSPLHPMCSLLDLTKRVLKATSIYNDFYKPVMLPDHCTFTMRLIPPDRKDVNECLEGLGKAFDLLMKADPALEAVDILSPTSNKTGLPRLLELVGLEESETSLMDALVRTQDETFGKIWDS